MINLPAKLAASTWVIVPGHNEAKYVEGVLDKVSAYTPNIIFVDDGSSDSTALLAESRLNHVLKHLTNLGKGAALKTGCEYAFNHLDAQRVIFFDSDDQHDPEHLPEFEAGFNDGFEVVLGVRRLNRQMPKIRRLGNAFSSVLIYLLFGRYIPDIPCGFKGLTRDVYQKIKWNTTGYAVETEIAARIAKCRIPYKGITVKTIYHQLDRGMTALDILKLSSQIISWKFTL